MWKYHLPSFIFLNFKLKPNSRDLKRIYTVVESGMAGDRLTDLGLKMKHQVFVSRAFAFTFTPALVPWGKHQIAFFFLIVFFRIHIPSKALLSRFFTILSEGEFK